MKLFLCSHFSSVGSLIKEEIENKKVAFIPTASLREGYTGYVGSARKLFKKLGAIVTEIVLEIFQNHLCRSVVPLLHIVHQLVPASMLFQWTGGY